MKNPWAMDMEHHLGLAEKANSWFTQENIRYALGQWGELLDYGNLGGWISGYSLDFFKNRKVALIMAGNIPLVGFHDFLAILLTGNSVVTKLSSNDNVLLPFLTRYLIHLEPAMEEAIHFTDRPLKDYDMVIATGSNNTARYFEDYFKHKPRIIRKNRNSVAILTGHERAHELVALGEDIFRYYGLGCRSVSKIFVPKGYVFDTLYHALFSYKTILEHPKYTNNYDYNKAVFLMSEFKFLDNGFLMLKEDESYASPIATLFYETYESKEVLKQRIQGKRDSIQCVVADGFMQDEIFFGHTQKPSLTDYADGVDTVDFLLKR
ncbi:MAG: acyl-CoA reductase [Bacteroidota bacterium]